jgi:translin
LQEVRQLPSPSTNRTPEDLKSELGEVSELARSSFADTHSVREQALRLSREIVQTSANSIRATHRGEYEQARDLLDHVSSLARKVATVLENHPVIYYAGYVEDGLKEYAEASATLAFAEGTRLAGPDELGVGPAPYLNGLAEAVGELRRLILDSLRKNDISRCEEFLGIMDEVYTILVTMDFPDAVTRGLRRSTDMARGILERTRGDLTMALAQRRLEAKVTAFQDALGDTRDATGPD